MKTKSRSGLIAKLAYIIGGFNASDKSCGRFGSHVDLNDDEEIAFYVYKTISNDACAPLKKEIIDLKAQLFDLQNLKK